MTTVAVAVKAGGGTRGDDGSRGAVQWAVDHLMDEASRFLLIHVVPTITSIPTPSGRAIPIGKVDTHVAEMYLDDKYLAYQEIFVPFKKLSKRKKMETLVLEGDDTASALLKYVTDNGVHFLVLGFRSTTFLMRGLRDSTVARTILERAPETCKVFVVSKGKVLNRPGTHSFDSSSRSSSFSHKESSSIRNSELGGSQYDFDTASSVSGPSGPSHLNFIAAGLKKHTRRSRSIQERNHPRRSHSLQEIIHQNSGNSILENDGANNSPSAASTRTKQAVVGERGMELNRGRYSPLQGFEVDNAETSLSDLSYLNSISTAQKRYPHPSSLQESSILEVDEETECASVASADTKQSDAQTEVEQLRQELMKTVVLYNQAFEDFVHAQNEVHFLSSECLEEERQVYAALRREEVYKQIAEEEKRKHLEAVKEIERARNLLNKQAYEKQMAEVEAIKRSLEKKKLMDELLSNDKRYRRYTKDEIERATDNFSEAKLIGEGSYGKVYKCVLDKTPVAVKVLRSDASEKKKEEFLTEIDVLCKLRHPHIVLLLGACPEIGCLVFEYMENGSLDHFVSNKSGRGPLPWSVRFRIAFEVACGLAFLHNTKPEPIIHRDLKPGNIFLDRNYVSKIGDVGLAKLLSNVTPDNITAYSDSVIFGSLYYVDPEYHRTGTVRPKSDLYGFGIIILQMLAAQHPDGLLLRFEAALSNGLLSNVLDKSIKDWPLSEAEELAQMALKCSRLRCRDRPDLETEVLPLLKRLADMADDTLRVQKNSVHPPNHYFCPLRQEVMEDPYIAADGFTYELRAIKEWLKKHNYSPVTKVKLEHRVLIQNHTLRSAIEEWRSQAASSSG